MTMIYPDNFEKKIGFNEIRTILRGRCLSSLGTEWVDNHLKFMTEYNNIREALRLAYEFSIFLENEDDIYEEHFYDVRQSLLRIRPERTYMEELELFDLKRSLKTIQDLVVFFQKQALNEDNETNVTNDDTFIESGNHIHAKYPSLFHLTESTPTFPEIINSINNILNKYGKIKDTASPELLSIRHSLEVTMRGISHSLRTIITEAQTEGYIDRDVSPTLRDGRLVIPVSPSLKRKIKGIIHDESATGKTVFIEPTAVVEANNRIRELKAAEKREIIKILQNISSQIRPHISDILESLHFLAHIDFLRALASFSKTFKSVIPNLQSFPCIDWVQAIHPLLQQSLERNGRKMVPLDITLKEGQKILLISGPNAGGKSVCLKTVGLLQYMLQCGMPVPVKENSRMGIFEDILIDIGDEQSIEDDLSTYSSHLLNMKQMMKKGRSRSLLLIDEFGGGTEPQIGGAIAEAILHQFVQNGSYGVITTHYQNLKHYAQKCPSVVNGAMLYDRAQMCPLFVLQIGNPGSSFAIEIARKIGISENVISYASELVGKDYIMSDKYLQDIVRDKVYWENKRKNIHKKEKHLEETITQYEEEIENFQQERKVIITQAKEQAQILLQDSNAIIEKTIRDIREAQAEKNRTREIRKELKEYGESIINTEEEDSLAKKIAKIKRRQERKKDPRNRKPNESTGSPSANTTVSTIPVSHDAVQFQVGMYVHIKGQTTIGVIESISGKQAKVLFGMMYTTLPLQRLEKANAPAPKDSVSQVSTFISKETRDAMYEKKLRFKPEIDLRGMRADEALTATAYFVDDAIQCEQNRIRILHGTGSGILRQQIRAYLSTVPGVKSYHDEHVQFGGAGITVIELE